MHRHRGLDRLDRLEPDLPAAQLVEQPGAATEQDRDEMDLHLIELAPPRCGDGYWAMLKGGNATIYVSDMDRAVTFYTETLGLRLTFRAGDHWAGIDAGDGLQLGLHPASSGGPAPGTAGAVTVGFAVDEPIEHVVSVLESRGVAVQGPVVDAEGRLKLAFFADPDGNPLYMAELGRD